jgi:hypothetical protein
LLCYVTPKLSNAKIRTSNALCGFARAKVAKMSDGKAKSSWAMAKQRIEVSRR